MTFSYIPCRRLALLMSLIVFSTIVCDGQQQIERNLEVITKPPSDALIYYDDHEKAGNTSVTHDLKNTIKWSQNSNNKNKSWGYFNERDIEIPYIKRDRDLGQTFKYTGSKPVKMVGVTVRTGFGTNAVRAGTYGREVALQLFLVEGSATLHDNNSDKTRQGFHGFPHNRITDSIPSYRDDYFIGENYKSVAVFQNYIFPAKAEFGFSDTANVDSNHPDLKGRLLRFELPESGEITLLPGKTYAFLIMLVAACDGCGFTLANKYHGGFDLGHAIRRDGNGEFPPVAVDMRKPLNHRRNKRALSSAHFPADLNLRTKIIPGTNGYPDVDTWRDFEFYIETE